MTWRHLYNFQFGSFNCQVEGGGNVYLKHTGVVFFLSLFIIFIFQKNKPQKPVHTSSLSVTQICNFVLYQSTSTLPFLFLSPPPLCGYHFFVHDNNTENGHVSWWSFCVCFFPPSPQFVAISALLGTHSDVNNGLCWERTKWWLVEWNSDEEKNQDRSPQKCVSFSIWREKYFIFVFFHYSKIEI